MKADQTLTTIFRQLRTSFSRVSTQETNLEPSHLRPFSQFAAFNHPFSSKSQLFALHSRRLTAHPCQPLPSIQTRYQSNTVPSSVSTTTTPSTSPPKKPLSYDLTFTCKPCRHRSSHIISKQGYHHGTVLITCPECKNRHVISDHLKIFADTAFTIEELMREKGDKVMRGTLEGDVEWWDDGTKVHRSDYEKHVLKWSKKLEGDEPWKEVGKKK